MFKRITLFVLTNLAILIVVGVVMSVLGALGYITPDMGGYIPLFIMSLLFGFGGSMVSLLMSKTIAKWTTGAHVIEQPRNQTEAWLVSTVEGLAQKAGIRTPEVAIYDAPDMNAFATGATRNGALVAVSTGLMRGMAQDEVEAVLAHEVSHAANGDMVTLSLLQGVLNTFVIFLSRVGGYAIDAALSRGSDRRGPGFGYWIIVMVLQVLLGILASIIVMWFSRRREYRADEGAARLTDPRKMVAALERLKTMHEPAHLPEAVAAFGIRSSKGGLASLLRSHPPLDNRIARLRAMAR